MRFALPAAAAFVAVSAIAAPAFAQTPSEAAAIEEFNRGKASADAKTNEQTVTIMTAVIDGGKLPKEWQPLAYFYRGQAYRRMDKFTDALADFDKSVAMNAQFAAAHFESGLAYTSQKKYKQAVGAYDKALKIVPDNAEYLYSRCVAKSWANDNAGARDDCRKAVGIKDNYVEAWQALGRAYEDLGQTDKALEAYRKVLKLDPGNAAAKEGIAYIEECSKPGVKCG